MRIFSSPSLIFFGSSGKEEDSDKDDDGEEDGAALTAICADTGIAPPWGLHALHAHPDTHDSPPLHPASSSDSEQQRAAEKRFASTLFLLTTAFDIRANAAVREPHLRDNTTTDLYHTTDSSRTVPGPASSYTTGRLIPPTEAIICACVDSGIAPRSRRPKTTFLVKPGAEFQQPRPINGWDAQSTSVSTATLQDRLSSGFARTRTHRFLTHFLTFDLTSTQRSSMPRAPFEECMLNATLMRVTEDCNTINPLTERVSTFLSPSDSPSPERYTCQEEEKVNVAGVCNAMAARLALSYDHGLVGLDHLEGKGMMLSALPALDVELVVNEAINILLSQQRSLDDGND
ncbi:hypothetical protein CF319_g8235 [Tilletia indica]|nr:hypothetical protein CF319_g8235 [Tilletia indica]